MIDQGVAMEVAQLEEPYTVVVFPKVSPSRPFELMMTVLPQHDGLAARLSLADFSNRDALAILQIGRELIAALHKTSSHQGVSSSDGYVFQHFNPQDLNPKTMFNGSVAHFHLHAQLYGHSLNEFPDAFTPTGKLRVYEGANRLMRDSFVSIFYELITQSFPEVTISYANSGCISFCQSDNRQPITQEEVQILKSILKKWDEVWKQVACCYSSVDLNQPNAAVLLPQKERINKVQKLLTQYQLSTVSQKVLIFLAKNIQESDDDVWRNFYHGPNGALGFHEKFEDNVRQWLIAPRAFRSWARHLPLVNTQESLVGEWTTKNESGDGLVNNEAQSAIYAIQRQVIRILKGV